MHQNLANPSSEHRNRAMLCLALLCLSTGCHTMNTSETGQESEGAEDSGRAGTGQATHSVDLDGVGGKVFRVDPQARTFQLLTETAFDPKTREGRSRHTLRWTDSTRFVKVERQNNFEGLEGDFLAHIRRLSEKNAEGAAAGHDFVTLHATILAAEEDGAGLHTDDKNLLLPFTPDPASHKCRAGTVRIDGTAVGLRLRGPRAQVDIRNLSNAKEMAQGFWGATVHGHPGPDGFVADSIDIRPRVDPRSIDDPELPRILVIGDSISMNYHAAAKEALKGVANYHRIDGNGGASDRGAVCTELWLGDYTQPGLHWDLIQFNHGLHDLKQLYDEESGEYGAYQVPVEEYKANLKREIQIMKQTGATLVWCSTTPVPQDYFGYWGDQAMGRRSAAVDLYNRAALELIRQQPEIRVNDLNSFIAKNETFEDWRKQKDVHFWDGKLQKIVGQAVADRLSELLEDETGPATSADRKDDKR